MALRRVVNLSSASAYGAAGARVEILDEDTPCDPVSFYAISKFTSERSVARHAELFGGDFLSVRFSAVFGPWERPGSVRDTPSLQYQILAAFARGEPAVMPEPGMRRLDLTRRTRRKPSQCWSKPIGRVTGSTTSPAAGCGRRMQWGEAFAALQSGP